MNYLRNFLHFHLICFWEHFTPLTIQYQKSHVSGSEPILSAFSDAISNISC